jgi:drug/metabolite transporter (DMT)-like permease
MLPDPFRTERGAVVMLVLTNLIWGGNYIASKVIVSESPPFTVAFVRFVLATSLILVLYALTPGARLPRRREWPALAQIGVAFFLYNLFFYTGLKATSSANAALLAATSPAGTALLSAALVKERVRPIQVGGLLLSFTGVALVVLKHGALTFNPGDFVIMAASLTWSVYSLLGKRAMATMSPLATTAYAWVIGTVLLFPAALLERHTHGWFAFSPAGWWSFGYVVVLSSVAAFTWWYKGIQRLGATRASVFLNLIPLTGLILSPLLMPERLRLGQLLGAALILSGVYLVAQAPALRPATTHQVEG